MNLPRLSPLVVEPLVRAALLEDLGLAGDITSNAVVPEDHHSAMLFSLRQPGVIAGLDVAEMAFRLVDPDVTFERLARDGQSLAKGADVARVSGSSRSILAGSGRRSIFSVTCPALQRRRPVWSRLFRAQRLPSSAHARRRRDCVPCRNMQSGRAAV